MLTEWMIAQSQVPVRGDTNVELVLGILMFAALGVIFIVAALFIGRLIRPSLPHPEKATVYECGEPTIGEGWVQFDLRFYIVALFFIIFDVEIAMLWPWAVVYKEMGQFALWAMIFFLVPIVVGFAYEWRFGYLDWVRASTGTSDREPSPTSGSTAEPAPAT